jgi:hypothetical protein
MNETIRTVLTCSWCNYILASPVILPCGETVCGHHETHFKDLGDKSTDWLCQICKQVHRLSASQHFVANKVVKNLLENEIENLNFGDDYTKALVNLKELQKELAEFERKIKSPEEVLFDYYNEMRTRADHVREKLIEHIDKCNESTIADINKYEEECKANLPNLKERLRTDNIFNLAEVRDAVTAWSNKIAKLSYNVELYDEINANCGDYLNMVRKSSNVFLEEVHRGRTNKAEFDLKYADLYNVFFKRSAFKK